MAAVTFLATASVGSAAALGGITDAGEVDSAAERVITTGEGLLFPIEPSPMCEVLNNFGGHSKAQGAGQHDGVDIGAMEGQEVYAVADGVLEIQHTDPDTSAGLGWRLWVDNPIDGPVQYRYYHLAGFADGLEEGSVVTKGQVIGYVGDTGNASPGGWHLHFEVRPGPKQRYGSPEPVDPVPLLDIPTICNVY
ncbi:peptidase M23-like protein [Ilumatobacter fluminis]|uniref:Peptidase M23-like protein n=1 Tax=Ilumatobacter fluminis TaxID=467091 RepID=A0A4R7HX62_9ACTN|nr:M23 family metallopeptidase [Ilumatobacter fluminis]TDT15164.1 peptidase M23-like protein [Ilumatobacter fluminis]